MKAVVMAGGEGSRLRPLTAGLPKPLVPICNRPIMEHILVLLKRHGIEDVIATVHYLADEIQSAFGDGSDFGVRLTYSMEEAPLGTAGSVKLAEAELQDDGFLIVSGDALTDCNLTRAMAFHKEKGGIATIVLCKVTSPLEFGVVITDGDGRVERFHEKPGWSEVFSDTVNTGIYILEPEVFQYMDSGRAYDWSGDIFPRLLEEGKSIFGFVMDGYWSDIGSLQQYRDAHEHMLGGQIDLPIPGEFGTEGIHMGIGCNIAAGVDLIPPVCLGDGVKVKRGAQVGPYVSIGDNALLEEDSIVVRSVVWPNAYIGSGATVRSAIIGERATLKRDVMVHEDAVIGDRCIVEVGAVVKPRVKIWPDKVIERGSTVTMSLIWGNRWRGALFRELGAAGLSNIEITPDFAVRLGAAFGSCMPSRSKVVTSRDSTRSSRMIKRAIISSLLSAGCDVLDLRSAAVPIARHFIKATGAAGAMHTRKLPGNSRVTLIELFDSRGAYLSRGMERKVETAFFREDFRRIDPDDLGVIDFASRAVEEYQADFFTRILPEGESDLKLVADYGYSSLAAIYPAMLERFGIESISLNGFNDAKQAPRTHGEIEEHILNVCNIVDTLNYDMGVLFTDEGERLTIVDDLGRVIDGHKLFGAMCLLVGKTHANASIAMSVVAPQRLEAVLVREGVRVIRTRMDARSLMNTALDSSVTFAGDERGGFIFPEIHPGFDAPFSFGKLNWMLQKTGLKLSEVVDSLPSFHLAYEQVPCASDLKGAVMRQLSESVRTGERVELVDGIKIFDQERWVLVLPDAVEPMFHIYAETDTEAASHGFAAEYAKKIAEMASAL
jgi:mannose-1-phosphate guanylyltransferase/phosphomannomutase